MFWTKSLRFQSPLLSLENVLITPHAAFYSDDAMREVRSRAAQEVIKVFKGELPINIVNRSVIEQRTSRSGTA